MVDTQSLGNKIRFFRKRAGLSQLELETAIDASGGTISRIENGEVNPTKETIGKIVEVLKLSMREVAYLNGPLEFPATEQEIAEVSKTLESYLSRRGVFAYIIDDRRRFIKFSKSFVKIVNETEEHANNVIGKTIITCMLDKSLPLIQYLSPENYEQLLSTQLSMFYTDMHFMIDDESYLETIKLINENEFAKNLWKSFGKKINLDFCDTNLRTVTLKLGKFNVPLTFGREPILSNPRFEIVEYKPTNLLFKIFSKLSY